MSRKKSAGQDATDDAVSAGDDAGAGSAEKTDSKNGSWQKIEALRERAALKASLADVWDEDFDLDEEILAELDHTAEFFTSQEEADEPIPDEDDDIGEYFDDEEV